MSFVFKIRRDPMASACMTLNRFNVHEHCFDAHRKSVFDRGLHPLLGRGGKNGAETQSLKKWRE